MLLKAGLDGAGWLGAGGPGTSKGYAAANLIIALEGGRGERCAWLRVGTGGLWDGLSAHSLLLAGLGRSNNSEFHFEIPIFPSVPVVRLSNMRGSRRLKDDNTDWATYGLDNAPDAYKIFRDKEEGCIKVVLKPHPETVH